VPELLAKNSGHIRANDRVVRRSPCHHGGVAVNQFIAALRVTFQKSEELLKADFFLVLIVLNCQWFFSCRVKHLRFMRFYSTMGCY
jgi:hypothetical protein